MKSPILILALTLAACVTPGPVKPTPAGQPAQNPAQLTPAQQFGYALDLSTCSAADVLPGVAETIGALAGDASALAKTLVGVVGVGGAVARAWACHTRAMATARTQDGGEVAVAAVPEQQLVAGRAAACSAGGRCPRPEHAAAFALQQLLAKKLVTLPTGPGAAASSPGPAAGGGG